MNKKEKKKLEILKRRFASQMLRIIGALAILVALLNVGIKVSNFTQNPIIPGCTIPTACTLVDQTLNITLGLGLIGVAGIVGGNILRSKNK